MTLLDDRGKMLSFVLTRDEAERLLEGLYRRQDQLGQSAVTLIKKLISAGVEFPRRAGPGRTEHLPPH